MNDKPIVRASIWLYQRLLFLYPEDFRRAYFTEMTLIFAVQCRRGRGVRAFLQLWYFTLLDLFPNAIEEISMTITRKPQPLLRTAILFGLTAGILGSINAITYASIVGELDETLISYIALFGIAALAFASGVTASRSSKSALTGLWVGLLVGVLASLIANTVRVGYSFAFYNLVRNEPTEIHDWLSRGGGPFVDYLIQDRLGGYMFTTLFLGVLGAISGSLGGLFSVITNRASLNKPT